MKYKDWKNQLDEITDLCSRIDTTRNSVHLENALQGCVDDLGCVEVLVRVATAHPETLRRISVEVGALFPQNKFLEMDSED